VVIVQGQKQIRLWFCDNVLYKLTQTTLYSALLYNLKTGLTVRTPNGCIRVGGVGVQWKVAIAWCARVRPLAAWDSAWTAQALQRSS